MKKLVLTALIAVSLAAIASVSWADSTDSFFQVGRCYLFMPRHDYFSKGQVVQVTPQEVVFIHIKVITATKHLKGKTDAERIAKKEIILTRYYQSKDRSRFEKEIPLPNIPASFSRAEMTALPLDRCGN